MNSPKIMNGLIYFDNQATTPIDPLVLSAYVYALTNYNANPNGSHVAGKIAERKIIECKEALRSIINGDCLPYLTATATEAINIVLKSATISAPTSKRHIITQKTEHKAVLETCRYLEENGFQVTYLGVDNDGRIRLADLQAATNQETFLVALMHANNEIGVIQPIFEVGQHCHKNGVMFMVDASQSLGKLPIDVESMRIDYLIGSSHKLYGPKGMGMLYASQRGNQWLRTYIHGGGQESNLRSGTPNVPLLIAFTEAVLLANRVLAQEDQRLTTLSNRLLTGMREAIGEVFVNGSLTHRLPGNLNICIPGINSELLIKQVSDQIAISSAAACVVASRRSSYVLEELGLSKAAISSSLRISLGRFTTSDEVDRATQIFAQTIQQIRHVLQD